MIETVQERQRGGYDFSNYYSGLCSLKDLCPLPAVKAHLGNGVLDLNGDRIKFADWEPIIGSLRINRNLDFVAIRSYFQLDINENTPDKRAKVLRSKIPSVRSPDITLGLCRALRECLLVTECLSCLELEGLPLRLQDMKLLSRGLKENKTLHHLSLEYCQIGDNGMEILCKELRFAGNITTINLTRCALTSTSAEHLASLLKYQGMCRHNEAWKESLRYRRPNLDTMSGLRRITLNQNSLIEDKGAVHLAEVLKDDLWVKALDLQDCGMGNVAARSFLSVLKYNATLIVLDMRRNPLIDRDLLRAVTEQVLINGDGKETEFRWLKADGGRRHQHELALENDPNRKPYIGPTKPLNASSRPAFKPGGVAPISKINSSRLSRKSDWMDVCSNESTPRRSKSVDSHRMTPGQPWRTASRAIRYKGYPPDHVPGRTNLEENSEDITTTSEQHYGEPLYTDRTVDSADSVVDPLVNEMSRRPPSPMSIKQLRHELLNLQRRVDKEAEARKQAEDKIIELMIENKNLRAHIEDQSRNSVLTDEAQLDNIERTLKQFHTFLNRLKEAGMSDVIKAAGMDLFTSDLEASRRSISKSRRNQPYGDAPSPQDYPPESILKTILHSEKRAHGGAGDGHSNGYHDFSREGFGDAEGSGDYLYKSEKKSSSGHPAHSTSKHYKNRRKRAEENSNILDSEATNSNFPGEFEVARQSSKTDADKLYEKLKNASKAGIQSESYIRPAPYSNETVNSSKGTSKQSPSSHNAVIKSHDLDTIEALELEERRKADALKREKEKEAENIRLPGYKEESKENDVIYSSNSDRRFDEAEGEPASSADWLDETSPQEFFKMERPKTASRDSPHQRDRPQKLSTPRSARTNSRNSEAYSMDSFEDMESSEAKLVREPSTPMSKSFDQSEIIEEISIS